MILVILSSCSEDDKRTSIEQEVNFTERLSFDHLPEGVKTNLKSNYSKKSKADFGYIDPEQFVFKNKIKNTNTYTMALRSSQKKSIQYFDNLVVKVQGDVTNYFVFRYIPTEEWLTSGKSQGFYSGGIQIFDFNTGDRVGSLKMQNGVETSSSNESKVCQWEYTGEFTCTTLNGYQYCYYKYSERCGGGDGTSGGNLGNPTHGGDSGSFPSTPSPGGTGTGGGFNSGGPGSINTNPVIDDDGDLIIVECLEGKEPNMFGICEEVYFEFKEDEMIFDEGEKPLEEFDNKCEGVDKIWEMSIDTGNEFAGVMTLDGAILITQELEENGGGVSGIYNFDGKTYYQYPTSEGSPSRVYPGQINNSDRYFIPITASIHTHTPCLNDGSDGISSNIIEDDQSFASHYPNINHYIIGCSAIGQFDGSSDEAFNINYGNLNNICNEIN